MTRNLVTVLLFVAAVAAAQTLSSRTQLNPPVPTNSADGGTTAGLELTGTKGWRVTASNVESASRFNGGGTLACYAWVTVTAPTEAGATAVKRWTPCQSTFNVGLTSGQRDQVSYEFTTPVGVGRIAYYPLIVAVTLPDAGTGDGGVWVTIEARK